MAAGVREITIRRGFDPREFPMVVAGGAGPNHACAIAAELGLPLFLVPRESSIFCAAGMLMTDLKHDFVRSMVGRLAEIPRETLLGAIEELAERGRRVLSSENVPADRITILAEAELRYVRQYHEVCLPLHPLEDLPKRFHAEHSRLYGYSLEEEGTPLEIINLRVRATGGMDKPAFPSEERVGPDPSAARKGARPVFVPEAKDYAEVAVFDGHGLRHGNRIAGPAIIEQRNTTLFVSASYETVVDSAGSFVVFDRARPDALPRTLKEVLR
jgi:N-methylhydantoinase A